MAIIDSFNQSLLGEDINIIDYVKKINDAIYKIDISFIDDFISLVDKDEFCIHHEMLQKYGVLSEKTTSRDVARMLIQNEMIENVDYELIGNLAEQLSSGTKYKNVYILHPRAFKICLIRSLKTKKYARYYIFLEEAIKHYNNYRLMRMSRIIGEKSSLSVLKLELKETYDNFVLFRTKDINYPYYTVRGQTTNVKKQMITRNFSDDDILLQLKLPHGVNFFNKVKEKIKKKNIHYKLNNIDGKNCRSNEFKLIDITTEQFVNTVRELHRERFSNYI